MIGYSGEGDTLVGSILVGWGGTHFREGFGRPAIRKNPKMSREHREFILCFFFKKPSDFSPLLRRHFGDFESS